MVAVGTVRDGEGCPFCGGRSRTAAHLWKSAVLTAMVPLGLAGCHGDATETQPSVAPTVTESKPEVQEPPPSEPEQVEVDSATPDPSGHDGEPPPPVDASGGDSSTPEGTDTPIEPAIRPPTKYGGPPRPKPKYGGPPRPPRPPPPEPVPEK